MRVPRGGYGRRLCAFRSAACAQICRTVSHVGYVLPVLEDDATTLKAELGDLWSSERPGIDRAEGLKKGACNTVSPILGISGVSESVSRMSV